MHWIWLALMLAVAGPVAGRIYWLRRRRRYELALLARRRGLTFAPFDLIGLPERYCNLALIRQGHNRHAWDVLYGSTPAGLVALFRYSYALGFGVRQNSRQWWVAVLERSRPFASWQAGPADGQNLGTRTFTRQVGSRQVWSDREETLELLGEPTTASALSKVPDLWHVEARGCLLAAVAPFKDDMGTVERLLDALDALGAAMPSAMGSQAGSS